MVPDRSPEGVDPERFGALPNLVVEGGGVREVVPEFSDVPLEPVPEERVVLGVVPDPLPEDVDPISLGLLLELVPEDLEVRDVVLEFCDLPLESICGVSSICAVSPLGAVYAGLSAKQTGHLGRLSGIKI